MNKLELIGDFIAESTLLYLWPIMNIAPNILEPSLTPVLIILAILLIFIFQVENSTPSFRTDIQVLSLKKNWQLRLLITALAISSYCIIVSEYAVVEDYEHYRSYDWNVIKPELFMIVTSFPAIMIIFILWIIFKTHLNFKLPVEDTLYKTETLKWSYKPINNLYIIYMIGFFLITFNFVLNKSITLSRSMILSIGRNSKMDFILYLVEIGLCYLAYLFIKYIRNLIKQE